MGIFRWGGMFMAEVKRNNVAIERMETLMHPEPPLAPVKKRHLSLAHPREIPLSIDRDSVEALERLEVRGLCFRYDSVKQEKAQEDGEPSEEAAELTETSRADEADRGSSGELPLPFGIEDISFSVEGGSLVVVTGQIGSGKTTLLKSVIGILPVQAGSVLWNGEEAPSGGKLERSRFWDAPRAAYTPQVPRLFSNTLRENVLLGIPEDKADLAAAIRDACLEADLAEMPAGLDTEIGPRGVRLSGGQVQRTAAARMFARGARLMVLDDISSALDVETEKTLWDRLLSSKGRATYLVASHREALLRRADTILLMHEGRLAAQGSFAELMLSSSLFRSLMKREQHPELN